MPPKGKGTRQPARPAARYRRGKGAAQVESDSDSDDAQSPHAEQGDHHDEEEETPVLSRAKEERAKMRIGLRAVEVDEKGAVKVDGRAESGRTARELERDSAEERTFKIQLLPLPSSTHSILPPRVAESDSEDEEDVKPTNRTAASRTIAPPGSDEVIRYLHLLSHAADSPVDTGIIGIRDRLGRRSDRTYLQACIRLKVRGRRSDSSRTLIVSGNAQTQP